METSYNYALTKYLYIPKLNVWSLNLCKCDVKLLIFSLEYYIHDQRRVEHSMIPLCYWNTSIFESRKSNNISEGCSCRVSRVYHATLCAWVVKGMMVCLPRKSTITFINIFSPITFDYNFDMKLHIWINYLLCIDINVYD